MPPIINATHTSSTSPNDRYHRSMDRLKLLLIEDDADQRELIRETLLDSLRDKIEVVAAVGSKAEAMAQDIASFDLVLSDYNLPDATGLEVLAEIRARCTTPDLVASGARGGQIAAQWVPKGAMYYG